MNILKIIKKYKKYILLILIFSCIQVTSELFLPKLMSEIVDKGIITNNIELIINKAILMLISSIISIISVIIVIYFTTKFSSLFSFELRKKLYNKITKLNKTDIDKFGSSSLITRCTNDVVHISEMFSLGLRLVLFAPLMAVAAVIMAYTTEPSLSYIIFFALIILIISIIIIFALVYKKFIIIQKIVDKLSIKTRENLYGFKVIRAFNKEKYFEKRFDEINVENKKLNLFVNKILLTSEPLVLTIINFASLFVVIISINKINIGNIELGSIMAFIQYMSMILMSFTLILLTIVMIPRTLVSIKRVEKVLNTKNSIKNEGKKILKNIEKIEFKNVSYKYKNAKENTINNISLTIEKPYSYGIIGSSGSGKTTLINLLLRNIEPTDGNILINNIDIKEYTIESLRQRMSLVPEKAKLFNDTIKENLIFDENITKEEILKVLDYCNLTNFINKNKLNYKILQGSNNLSGGEKQRFTIARALLKQSDLYILDDAFTSLDYTTTKKIKENLNKYYNDKIKITISKRIGTIKDCDKIIVLENGIIDKIGNFKYLSLNSEVFKDFITSEANNE